MVYGEIKQRIVRTECDLDARTGEGVIYVTADGRRWKRFQRDGGTQGTGVQLGRLNGNYVCTNVTINSQAE